MKIDVRSTHENYVKERDGLKPNTVRLLDGNDMITVHDVETKEQFTRIIKDITVYNGIIIISWKDKE